MSTGDPKVAGPRAAGSSRMSKLLGTLVGALLLLGVYYMFIQEKPPVDLPDLRANMPPEVEQFQTDLRSVYMTGMSVVGRIKDQASAEAARSDLELLNGKIDEIQELRNTMPEEGKAMISGSVASHTSGPLSGLKESARKALEDPEVAEKVQPALDEFLEKLTAVSQ